DMGMIDVEGVERAVVAMGLRNLGTMMQTDTYADGKCVSKSYHASGASAAGTQQATAAVAPTISMDFLKWVPKQAVGMQAGKMNVMAVYDTLLKGLNAYSPDFAKMAMQHLGEVEQQVGFKVRDDLFGAF